MEIEKKEKELREQRAQKAQSELAEIETTEKQSFWSFVKKAIVKANVLVDDVSIAYCVIHHLYCNADIGRFLRHDKRGL